MPTWLKIFEGEPYPWSFRKNPRKKYTEWVCSFCNMSKNNLQPIDVVRQGKTPRQTKFYQLCCIDCWRNTDLVVYHP